MKVDRQFYRRWAEVYLEKKRKQGVEAAKAWADRFLPSTAVPHVKHEIKKIKEAPPPQ